MFAWLNLNLHNIVTDKINQNYEHLKGFFLRRYIVRSHVDHPGCAAAGLLTDFSFRSIPNRPRNHFKRSSTWETPLRANNICMSA